MHPPIDAAGLWAMAEEAASDGDERGPRTEEDVADFRIRLESLTRSLQDDAKLSPLGHAFAHGQLWRAVRQRLELGALWSRDPEILVTDIQPPIIVVGQMRSGTTRIHRLLAADPAHAATRFCDSWNPVPRSPDTRPLWSALTLMCARTLDPWIDSIHPMGVTRPDEELGWLACALDHCAYEAQWRIPSYTAFSEARDPAPVYREFARILRTDAHFHGNASKRRVLKVPQFAEDLGTLLQQFPDAAVVMTRRCQDDTATSSASLVANQMTIQSDDVDLDWIHAETRRKIELRRSRVEQALDGFEGPLAIVDFDALGADWEAEIDRVYEALGLVLSTEAIEAMREEQNRAAESSHSAHSAQLRAFAQQNHPGFQAEASR
ncbi:sulfotransferase [Aurantiacibacter aquimixticola]|uniref:Sulfotransferase n=2 Tax=Aurantiacibacter aquimixticola TaxID=1958945 RepID=A0A419RWE9_9SPHN|nr:sulfotransferase [Aurantiacibacter aquimixticola]